MKKSLFYIFFIFTSISYGQVFQNYELKVENSHDKLVNSNNSKHSLNLDFFELRKITLNESQTKKSVIFYSPLFSPKDEFFLRTMLLDNNIEYQKDIYDYVEPTYYLRSVG